jgi:hypothetical protein
MNLAAGKITLMLALAPAAGSAPAPVGLQYQLLQYDNTGLQNYGPVTQQAVVGQAIILGEEIGERTGQGTSVGYPARPDPGRGTVAATVPILLLSATAAATRVLVREFP